MKKTKKKASRPVVKKKLKKAKPAVAEPVILEPTPPKRTNPVIAFFKFLFAVISFPFKSAAKLGKKTKMAILALIGAAVFLAMAGFSWMTQPLAAFYAVLFLPFEYIRVARFDLALPPYFTVNLIIFILCAGWFIKQLPRVDGNRAREKANIPRVGITIPLITAGYVFLVWMFLNDKFYGAQNIMFFALLIITAVYSAGRDLKDEPVNDPGAFPEAKEFGMLLIFSGAVLVLYMFDWKSWKYSFIGDEYAFFEFARNIITGATPPMMLYEEGVYGDHPVWTSVYQSLFMRFHPFFGWKLSSAIVPALTIIPLYIWIRMIFNRTTAVITSVAFAFSMTNLAFAHIPHNIIHTVFPFAAGLLFLELAIRRNSSFWTFMAAAVIGIGCYTFYSARLVPVIGILYWFFHPLRNKYAWNRILPGILVFLGTISFIVINPRFIDHMTAHSVITGSEISNPADRPLYMVMNYFHTFFAFIYRELMSHFVPGKTADFVSAFGILAGLTWTTVAFFRDWRAKFLFISYAVLVFFIGGIVQYNYPPNTRLTFLSPILAILTGVGFARITAVIPKGRNSAKLYRWFIGVILAGIIIFSSYSFYIYMPKVFPFTAEAVAIKYILKDSGKKNIVMATNGYHMMGLLSGLYGFDKRFEKIEHEVFEIQLNRDEFKGKILILSTAEAGVKPGIENLVKDGMSLYDEMHRKVFLVYDFSDADYYAAFKEYWNTGKTSYVVQRGAEKPYVAAGKLHAPSFARHEPRRKAAAKAINASRASGEKKAGFLSFLVRANAPAVARQLSPSFDFKPLDSFMQICKKADYGAVIPVRTAKVTKVKHETEFDSPSDIAVSADGSRIFIADGIAYKVFILDKQGDGYKLTKTIFLSDKKSMLGPVDDRPQDMKEHVYLEFDARSKMLYVMDVTKDTVKQYDYDGEELKTVVFNSFVHGARSISLSKEHNMFALSSPGKNLLVFFGMGGEPMGYYATTNGELCGQMSQPCYVEIDSKGNRYVLDTINRRVQVYSPDMKPGKSFEVGTASTIHGPQIKVFENTPEPFMAVSIQYSKSLLLISLDGKKARTVEMKGDNMNFVNPSAMDVDVNGNIYVLDPRTKEIAKVELPAEPMK